MVVANIGWDLQAASNGRFVLGIGSQVKGHNERRFSASCSAFLIMVSTFACVSVNMRSAFSFALRSISTTFF